MAQVYNAARNERRKMMLQAALNARRNSLMNLITPDVYAEEGPGTALPVYEELTPHPTVSSNVVEPRISAPLPGQDIVDAINAENLAFANQHPGQDLTDVFNRQAALRTGNDLANMRSAEVEREARAAVVQNQFMNNALEQHPNSPPPGYQDQAAPPQVAAPMATDYGPGLTPAAAEELYGPGGMYGTQPLAGGLYDQMGISPAGMGISPTGMGSTISSPVPTKTASQHLADEINTIKRKAGIIRGTAALFGGNPKAADRYEAKALADLGIYAGQYAMSQLTDADFQDKQTLFQSLLAKGMPLDQIQRVLESGVADGSAAPKPPKREKRKETDPATGQTYEITEEWNATTGQFEEVSRAETKTGPMVQIMPGEGALDKGNAEKFAANFSQLIDDPERTYAGLRADNERIEQLQDALDKGLQTGATAELFLTLGRMVQSVAPQTEATQAIFSDLSDRLGTAEWFKATSERFIGGMLAMTKGAVSDREMKIFMGMIPSLSTTKKGNQRLLRMMKELNDLALSEHYAAQDLNEYLIDQGISMSQLGTAKSRKMLDDFKKQREGEARARFERESKPETFEEAVAQIKALNPSMSDAEAEKVTRRVWSDE